MVGYDPEKQNTEFFNRLIFENSDFEFNLPKSPNILRVKIFEENEGNTEKSNLYQLYFKGKYDLQFEPLVIDTITKEFLDFCQDFCLKAGYTKPGDYYSKNGTFLIRFMDDIDGITPARIYKYGNYIEASKLFFDKATIPIRNAWLLHEFSHNYFVDETLKDNDKIEEEADKYGRELYLKLGYPYVEWQYAWIDIFNGKKKAHINRLNLSFAGLLQKGK
jgi:hypothetical protein